MFVDQTDVVCKKVTIRYRFALLRSQFNLIFTFSSSYKFLYFEINLVTPLTKAYRK